MEQYKAIFIAAILANKAFSHLVTTINNIVSLMTDQNLFIYNITIFISHYTADNFVNIIINTGIFKQFIAEYS